MKKLFVALVLGAMSLHATAANLILNGDFSNGLVNWSSNKESAVNSNFEFESNVTAPANMWDWNLSYPLSLEAGVEYKLTFKAKASVARELVAGWGMNASPWSADVESYALSTSWQTFEYVGVLSYNETTTSRLIFDYGHQAGAVYIDDIVLEKVEAPVVVNLVDNGDFSAGHASWNVNNETVINEEGVFQSDVTWAANSWDWSLSQPVALKAGVEYRLSFRAKASQMRELKAGWGKNEADWAADLKPLLITSQWSQYSIKGFASFGEFANSRIIFDYGHQLGTVYLDDIVFEEIVPETEFVTEDGTFVLGTHLNEAGEEVITEVHYDIGAGYLTPRNFAPNGGGWIIDNPQASTVDGDMKKSTVEFKGLYIEDCYTGEWINIQNTEFAYNSDPLVIIPSLNFFTLNHYYIKTLAVQGEPLIFLNERFLCDQENDIAEFDVVVLPGIDEDGDGVNDEQIVMVEGSAKFAYVIDHK